METDSQCDCNQGKQQIASFIGSGINGNLEVISRNFFNRHKSLLLSEVELMETLVKHQLYREL